ncbi:hypothetical protein [Prevotella sp. 10(H)]|uniref:hypothetical protein n=1 Tax=Prevotella sp. 10(H) TaxID=1158294 RepID=UPI0004A72767|nr:hypothetical protein [Prevotella sp. 10(H)]
MKKNIFFPTLLAIFSIVLFSCGDDNEPVPNQPLDGEWLTQKRVLETNDEDVNKRVNKMFEIDAEDFILKRVFEINKNIPDLGTVTTLAYDPDRNINAVNRDSDFTLVGDSMNLSDKTLGIMPGTYTIKGNLLVTKSKVNKQAIQAIITEIGGDPNIKMKDDIEGILTITDKK